MADRKARTITFKLPITATLGELKKSLDKESARANPTVIQDLGAGQFLVELETKEQADEFIDSGLDFDEIHINCRPPQGYYINVSILGLRAYISDEAVLSALAEFGETKSQVIRLKYKSDHELAGLENGNRLVKMVLTKPSIPYSLRIDGEWCRVIHNQQQRVCSNCHAIGHSRRKCPEITCRICGEKGHLSYDCTQETETAPANTAEEIPHAGNNFHQPVNHIEEYVPPTVEFDPESPDVTEKIPQDITEKSPQETPLPDEDMSEQETSDQPRTGTKRHLPTDSDSDTTKPQPQRRPRIKPTPNLNAERPKKDPKKDKSDSPIAQQVQ